MSKMKFIQYIFIIFSLISFLSLQAEIILHKRDATVWGQNQNIKGELIAFFSDKGTLYLNDLPIQFQVSSVDSSFEVPIKIGEGVNRIFVEIDSIGTMITSDTLTLTLGFKLRPEVFAFPTVSRNGIQLHTKVIENPDETSLSFFWEADEMNPTPTIIQTPYDSVTNITLAGNATFGEYYFSLMVVASDGDTVTARTFVSLDSTGIHPFQIKTDHASWIDRAVIYEITPCDFVNHGDFNQITKKIHDLVELGITAIWIQPIFETPDVGGQGYGITDFFKIRSELGSEADLHKLIRTAHHYGIKVMLDMVPNHSYIDHPYARNSVKYRTDSHYYDFYQHTDLFRSSIPYSQFYNPHPEGFVYYFWEDLPNLNYDNAEVQRWMIEICKYWIEKFDIDGYRFDAVWGVNARKPEFTRELRLALKRVKPEILMLAEDKATSSMVFDERFDVAFDWARDPSWVSKWSWQTEYHDWQDDKNSTIFNTSWHADNLKYAINNYGQGYSPEAIILRYMENNDLHRFIRHHGLERTRMVAALMFALPGIPLIYNGQEIGFSKAHPYGTEYIFERYLPIRDQDTHGLFAYYQQLIHLRKNIPTLYHNNFQELNAIPPNVVYAFRRWSDAQNIFCMINLSTSSIESRLKIPTQELNLDVNTTYYLTDLLNGEVFSGNLTALKDFKIPMQKNTTRILILADTVTTVGINQVISANIPQQVRLHQNYPNPFNSNTLIRYSIPADGKVNLTLFNILGEEIAVLIDSHKNRGTYDIQFNANQLGSGLYFYRLQFESQIISKKLMIIK